MKLVRDKTEIKDVCDQSLAHLQDAVAILGNVYVCDVSHCNIPPNNLTIDHKGKLRITSWYYARLSSTLLGQEKELVEKWMIPGSVKCDMKQGHYLSNSCSPMYSNKRILALASKCGLVDNIESLWNSILHLLAVFDMKETAKTYTSLPAYMFQNEESLKMIRAGCAQYGYRYLSEFGAQNISGRPLRYFSNRLHKLLFLGNNSKNISAGMAAKSYGYMRVFEIEDFKWLFGPDLCKRLQGKSMADVCPTKK